MSNQITPTGQAPQTFAFGHHALRVIMRDGEPWFVASDVAKALGYTKTDHLLRMLDLDEKGALIVGTLGGPQEMAVINESGLNAAIFSSRKPEARAYRKWVTSEVLPSIRKTGRYAAPTKPERYIRQKGRVPMTRELEQRVLQGFLDDLNGPEIARMCGISDRTVRRILAGQQPFGLDAGPDLTTPEMRAAVAQKRFERDRDRIAQELYGRHCISAANLPLAMEHDRKTREMLHGLGVQVPELQTLTSALVKH